MIAVDSLEYGNKIDLSCYVANMSVFRRYVHL